MKKQKNLKSEKKSIQVAYFWDEKDDSKIQMIMTKTQKLYPEEKFIKAVKAMLRRIKKLPKIGDKISLKEVLTIIEGEQNGTDKDFRAPKKNARKNTKKK